MLEITNRIIEVVFPLCGFVIGAYGTGPDCTGWH